MLRGEQIETFYGYIRALRGVSIEVDAGEIVAIVGANGAGKTTLLMTISGIVLNSKGKVLFEGIDISECSPSKRVSMGISQVPEGRHVFPTLSLKDNLALGAFLRYKREGKEEIHKYYEVVFDLFPILRNRQKQKAGTLSGGEQQMVAIGRALMANPKLLLLDEPSMGLAPVLKEDIFSTIMELKSRSLTILLVEQDVAAALSIADRGYVLQNGQIIFQDTCDRLIRNPKVEETYLGRVPDEEME
jgi:branched-chain amino acid transport system ATP-binding protein